MKQFLKAHKASSSSSSLSSTHTRIPDKTLNIHGGSYCITSDILSEFYGLYCEHVFENENDEYLTEKQIPNGPILLDFDFRYSFEVQERQHTSEHVDELLFSIYLIVLGEMCHFTKDCRFPIYIFEKPTVFPVEEKNLTKDGIHIIIGIQLPIEYQIILREKVLERLTNVDNDYTITQLPFINSWDTILDEGISKGSVNWQMYGSKKPGNMAYRLVKLYRIGYDETDSSFTVYEDDNDLEEYKKPEKFCEISAQYQGNLKVTTKEILSATSKHKKKRNSLKQSSSKKTKKATVSAAAGGGGGGAVEEEDEMFTTGESIFVNNATADIEIEDIVDEATLHSAVELLMKSFKYNEYHLKEIHQYTQILDDSFYKPGSHDKNRQVAFALKHTDDRLFLSWVMLRSKSDDFEYSTIPTLYEQWNRYFNLRDRQDELTFRSIIYWAKTGNYEEYLAIKKQTINVFIEESIRDDTEYDFAYILFQLFKEQFVCTSIKHKTWFMYTNHRWMKDDGESLRKSISNELYELYIQKLEICKEELKEYMDDAENPKLIALKARYGKIMLLVKKLKTTSSKNNIFRETMEIFYDKDFISRMDSNPYLMCFQNGVVDFKNRCFRDGCAQDYITKTTGINYIPFETIEQSRVVDELREFMRTLFPLPELESYMWDHLASVFIGANLNQTFNIYLGNGSNGKSLLMELMKAVLGEYKGTVPVTLVTEKRNSIGGTSSEIAQLKGLRYAVMQEPSDGASFNEGVVKEMTGGDPIQARGLYCDSEVFILQCTLACCTNTLFDIKATDDGTWRRIVLVDFMSKFIDENDVVPGAAMPKYTFIKDKKLKEKFPMWAPAFASMLIHRAFETQGVVHACELVMRSSNKYRKRQDVLAAFISEKLIVADPSEKVKRVELMEMYKIWYTKAYSGQGGKMPAYAKLHELMDKTFGPIKKTFWSGVQMVYSDETDEEV
jgi:P4 family phage/plasmid primase-like protien